MNTGIMDSSIASALILTWMLFSSLLLLALVWHFLYRPSVRRILIERTDEIMHRLDAIEEKLDDRI